MKIPKTIKICGHIYKINFPYAFIEEDRMGQCSLHTKEIYIRGKDLSSKDLPESSILVTFIHEVLHTIDRISDDTIFKDHSALVLCSELISAMLVDNGYVIVDKNENKKSQR